MKKTARLFFVFIVFFYACKSDQLKKSIKNNKKSTKTDLSSTKKNCKICLENKEFWTDSILSIQAFLIKHPEDNQVKSNLINAYDKFKTFNCEGCDQSDMQRIAEKCTKVFEVINDSDLEMEIERELVIINN